MRHATLIAYDIVSDKRRNRVHRCLKQWGLAAQYSVFECQLSHKEAEALFLQLTRLLNEREDKLLLAWLDRSRQIRQITVNPQQHQPHPFQTPLWYGD